MIALVLSLAMFSAEPAKDIAEASEKFSYAVNEKVEEELFYFNLLRKDMIIESKNIFRPTYASVLRSKYLTPTQRVEWAMRLGFDQIETGYWDLEELKDIALLDRALFKYLEFRIKDFFEPNARWGSLAEEYRGFFKKIGKEKKQQLFSQEKREWWKWIDDDLKIKNPDLVSDKTLVALDSYIKGKHLKRLQRIEHLLKVRYYVSQSTSAESLANFDKKFISWLLADYGTTPLVSQAVVSVEGVQINSQKIPFLKALANYWAERGQAALVADAVARSFLEALKQGRKITADEMILLGEFDYTAKRNYLALRHFHVAAEKAEDPWTKAKALALRAYAVERWADTQSQRQPYAYEWSAEAYREALELGMNTFRREDLMEGYARTLYKAGYWQSAIKFFKLLAQSAGDEQGRERGWAGITETQLRVLDRLPKQDRENQYREFVKSLTTVARNYPSFPKNNAWLREAKRWQVFLLLHKDEAISASLNEVEKIVKGRNL